jgi:hypothetical protein
MGFHPQHGMEEVFEFSCTDFSNPTLAPQLAFLRVP